LGSAARRLFCCGVFGALTSVSVQAQTCDPVFHDKLVGARDRSPSECEVQFDTLIREAEHRTFAGLATIKPPSMGTLSQIAKLLKDNPALKLEVGGHTDADGDAAKNLTLSQARADAVKQALVDAGIDAARLTTKGYGATKPVDVNTTLEGKANNRRVEFTKIGVTP
jgi:outer membrane protein OmpA-like peptidoglycan-associated protein